METQTATGPAGEFLANMLRVFICEGSGGVDEHTGGNVWVKRWTFGPYTIIQSDLEPSLGVYLTEDWDNPDANPDHDGQPLWFVDAPDFY